MRLVSACCSFAMLLGLSAPAFGASKDVRDAFTSYKFTEEAKKVEEDVMKSCGCRIPITADQDSYKTHADVGHVNKTTRRFSEMAKSYCSDDASKKELCASFTKVELTFAPDGKLDSELKGSTLIIHSNAEHNSDKDDMKKLVKSK